MQFLLRRAQEVKISAKITANIQGDVLTLQKQTMIKCLNLLLEEYFRSLYEIDSISQPSDLETR